MSRSIKVGISLLTVVAGWFLTGIGYTTKMGHPASTILFLMGIGLFMVGIIAAITWGRNFRTTTMKYAPGDICSIDDGAGEIGIVKVLAIEPGVIHLMIYKNKFSNRPKTVDLKQLSLGKLGDEDGFGIGHIPLDIEGFKNWKPQLIANEPVTEDELVGYNIWRESQ